MRLVLEKDRYGYEISKEIGLTYGSSISNQRSHIICCVSKAREKGIDPDLIMEVNQGVENENITSITKLGKAYLKETVKEWQETKEIINLFRLFSQTLLLLVR